ncbi:MAG: YqaE/Pmp3 family membrane protein [Chloroflexota bacterium]|nr:YqaE/Pmp3 family membrane protein [Chloroflexota bacterium]
MLKILDIIAPPIAILITGRPFTALLNFSLTLLLWIPGVIHALMVVSEHKATKRFHWLEKAIEYRH